MGTTNIGMPDFEKNHYWNNTYQSVRVINGSDWAANANWLYSEWCTGEREFYNVTDDPHQIHNIVINHQNHNQMLILFLYKNM